MITNTTFLASMIRSDHALHLYSRDISLYNGIGIYSLTLHSNYVWLVLFFTSIIFIVVLLACSLRTNYFQESYLVTRAKEWVQQPLLSPAQDSILMVEAGTELSQTSDGSVLQPELGVENAHLNCVSETKPAEDQNAESCEVSSPIESTSMNDDLNKLELTHSMSSLSLVETYPHKSSIPDSCIHEPSVCSKTKEFSDLVLSKSESLDEACSRLETRDKSLKANRSVDEILQSNLKVSPSNIPCSHLGKSRKLQERRGSNHSLTIAVKPADNILPTVTTPRECSAAQFLLTAGNCMTRRQLRTCLDDIKSLHAEFWSIPTNAPDLLELISGCALKNRYRYVIPNPTSRVKLPSNDPSNPSTGYINANYIRAQNGDARAYIATQGPLANTISDFWLMVWAEKSPSIIMITKLVESRNTKCEPYIPEQQACYDDITITVDAVEEKHGCTVRQLSVQRGEEVHQVVHYWYTDWPDHNTPENPQTLVNLAITVVELYGSQTCHLSPHSSIDESKTEIGPVIVHCSAGVGRTGAFIALCQGLNQLISEDQVDILSIVCALRCDRGGMVQTAEQYEFIHRGLCLFERTLSDYNGH